MNDIKIFLEKMKKKSDKMVVKDAKKLPEEEKRKLAEYRKKYYKIRQSVLLQLEKTIFIKKISFFLMVELGKEAR